jgi:UV DNA damage repair endonuclease
VPEFMDVHHHMKGITADQLKEAHDADLAIQGEEGVVFKQAWADPESGLVYCLSEGPSEEAIRRIHERAGHPADEVHAVPLVV